MNWLVSLISCNLTGIRSKLNMTMLKGRKKRQSIRFGKLETMDEMDVN